MYDIWVYYSKPIFANFNTLRLNLDLKKNKGVYLNYIYNVSLRFQIQL